MSQRGKTVRYRILQKFFRFHRWHIVPVEQRPYGMEVIKWSNKILTKIWI